MSRNNDYPSFNSDDESNLAKLGILKSPPNSENVEDSTVRKSRRSVTFKEERDCILVPSRADIRASMKNVLWYSPAHIAFFKKCADRELQCFMALSGDLEAKAAHACLYQPCPEVTS